jgi:Encapsulating protein for peroxidase
MELWSNEQLKAAQQIVTERFAQNSVAEHVASHSTVDDVETTVRRNRFDFANAIVIDREVFGLYEPFSFCRFTKAQVDEFATMQSDSPMLKEAKVVTTLTRAASSLARWHDILFFRGLPEGGGLRPPSIEMPNPQNPPQGLREAAQEAERQEGTVPIPVGNPINEQLVGAVYDAVLRLETQGYYTKYHLVLGENLWRALHTPTSGSLVLPRERIEPTLMGGSFYRTTTLPAGEALLASMDGPTFDCVMAGDPAQQPRFEFLRVTPGLDQEEIYLFRVRERFAPRVRENRAIVRLLHPVDVQEPRRRRPRNPAEEGPGNGTQEGLTNG